MQIAIAIKDYAQKAAGCTHVQFVIPGFGVGYRAVRSITAGDAGNPSSSNSARKAGKIVTHDLGYQTIDFDAGPDTGFNGDIQLLWPEGIKHKSFAERRIVIPFYSPEGIGSSSLKTTPKSFRVSMPVREGKLILKEKSHEFFGRRAIGNMYFYYFDVREKKIVFWRFCLKTQVCHLGKTDCRTFLPRYLARGWRWFSSDWLGLQIIEIDGAQRGRRVGDRFHVVHLH